MSSSRLRLPFRLLEELRQHAADSFPEECCGILIGCGNGAGETRIIELTEVPNRWPGDRRGGYEIDPLRLLEAHKRSRRQGLDVVGYYHSHPLGEARPSELDRRRAWPGVSYLIAAVRSAGVAELRSWRLTASGDRFEEERLEVESSANES